MKIRSLFASPLRFVLPVLLTGGFVLTLGAPPAAPGASLPPSPALPREFRAAWIATVHNINWPSKPGLSASQQKAELTRIFDQAKVLRLNAVILQVRPACDAFYKSSFEPWSSYLTGKMGESPGYDPLAFAVEIAHKRGLELHAWFNPFRAMASASVTPSSDHVVRTNPEAVRPAGTLKWLDPSLEFSKQRALDVIGEVVRKYDVDGVHLDDYFYPYPKNAKLGPFPFEDDEPYEAYRDGGGALERAAWRRSHIDAFVERLYGTVKSIKPWVKLGISPFGIYRPGIPPGIEADLDSYDEIFADSRKWLRNGWCDYFTPQLYWRIDDRPHSFKTLFEWWDGENAKRRHVWPGIASDRIGKSPDYRKADESIRQVEIARSGKTTAPGHVHWSIAPLLENRKGVTDLLISKSYPTRALVPASPWLSGKKPVPPPVRRSGDGAALVLPDGGSGISWWTVQLERGGSGGWVTYDVIPGSQTRLDLPKGTRGIAVRAIDRYGNASAPAVVGDSR